MLKCLSGFTDEKLNYYLARVREIAAHDDTSALIETDKLLWEMLEVLRLIEAEDYEDLGLVGADQDYPSDMEIRRQRAREALQKLQRKVENNTVRSYDIDECRMQVKRSHTIYPSQEPIHDEELEAIKAECLAFAASAEIVAFTNALEVERQCSLRNISSVMAMDDGIKRAVDWFTQRNELTPDLEQQVRQIRERGAHFRSNRKIASAKVAEAAGFVGKAAGLRREAAALLAQDWDTIFPGELPPAEE